MKVYITGISGTGKTTISKALIARGVTTIDIDDISHWENKLTGEWVGWKPGSSKKWHDLHGWLCDIDELEKILVSSENVIAIGHAHNQDAYLAFFDKIFILTCSPETAVARIMQRTDNDFGKDSAEQKILLEWQGRFEDEMLQKGASKINVERPLERVVADILSKLN